MTAVREAWARPGGRLLLSFAAVLPAYVVLVLLGLSWITAAVIGFGNFVIQVGRWYFAEPHGPPDGVTSRVVTFVKVNRRWFILSEIVFVVALMVFLAVRLLWGTQFTFSLELTPF